MKTEHQAERTAAMARQWSLLFETYDGMCHPLRITFSEAGSEDAARRHAAYYLKTNARWLKSLSDCYPSDSELNQPSQQTP